MLSFNLRAVTETYEFATWLTAEFGMLQFYATNSIHLNYWIWKMLKLKRKEKNPSQTYLSSHFLNYSG